MKQKIKKVKRIKKVNNVKNNNNQYVFKVINFKDKTKMLLSNIGLINYAQNIYNTVLDVNQREEFKKLVNKNGEFDNFISAKKFLEDNTVIDIQVRVQYNLNPFLINFVKNGTPIYFENFNEEIIVEK